MTPTDCKLLKILPQQEGSRAKRSIPRLPGTIPAPRSAVQRPKAALTTFSWSASTPTLRRRKQAQGEHRQCLWVCAACHEEGQELCSSHAHTGGRTHRTFRQDSMAVVPPPKTQTVKKTMSSVVLNIICLA